MKTLLKNLILLAVLPMFIGGLSSCEVEQTTKINPVLFAREDPIRVFFEQDTIFECLFPENNTDVMNNIDTCILINNTTELHNQISCLFDSIPNIDFKTKTLIIGRCLMPKIYYKVVEQHIVETKTLLDLNLKVQHPEGTYEAFSMMYYWGIYPKLSNKNIKINIIKN